MAVPEEPAGVASALECLDREAEAVRTAQLTQALSRLEAQGELTPAQRAAVEELSERLVARVLAGPRAGLRDSSDQSAAAGTVLALFD